MNMATILDLMIKVSIYRERREEKDYSMGPTTRPTKIHTKIKKNEPNFSFLLSFGYQVGKSKESEETNKQTKQSCLRVKKKTVH